MKYARHLQDDDAGGLSYYVSKRRAECDAE